MQAEQAKFLLDSLLPQIEEDSATTRKVLAAIPEERKQYRPEPKSRNAFELAWHVASSDVWFLDGIIRGQFGTEEDKMPAEIKTVADIRDWYDRKMPGLLERLKALSGEELAREIPFFGLFNRAAVAYLIFMLIHVVHHRGWLAAYLRPMGGKVPSIYGGSADEPFQMPEPQPAS